MKLIAHRCGPGAHPEQTIASALRALELGAAMAEMDVRLTRDGEPVISHDANAARIFGLDCEISQLTLEQFLALRHQKNRAYPAHSLDDALRCGVAPLLLHMKVTGAAAICAVGERIAAHGCASQIVIGVTSPQDAAQVKRLPGGISVLAFMPGPQDTGEFCRAGADAVRLWEDWVTPERVAQIHALGREAWVMAGPMREDAVGYTTESALRGWMAMGVEAVLVNDIAWAQKVLNG